MVNSKKSTKKGYTRSFEEAEMILDNIPGLVFYKDDKNNLIRVNKYFADAHKTTKEALAGKNCFDIYPKDVAQKYFDDDLEVIKSKKPKLNFIEPWDVVEGRRWVNSNKIPLYDDDGKCIGIITFSTDITEQVKAEQKLKQAHEQFDTIFSNLKDTVFVISEDYKILFKNDTAHDIFGTELIGKECYNVIKGQDQPCERCAMKTFAESDLCQVCFEQCVNTPFLEGERVFDIVSSPIESYAGQPAMLEVLRDNTERVKMEAEIRKLSAYNRNLIEISLDPLVIISPDGKITDVSRATEIVTGRSREDLIGTEFSSCFTEPERASEGYKKVFETGSIQNYELGLQHIDGHITPVMYNASTFKDEAGNVIGVFATTRDITEQKKAEEILKKSKEQLDIIFSNLKDTVFVISEDYKIIFKNDTAHDLFGKELIGEDCYKVIKGQSQVCEPCPMKIFAESDLCQVRFEQCVNTSLLKGERVFDIVSSPIESYAGQPAIVEILRDNTERKKIEEELKEYRDHLEYMVIKRTKELNCLYGLSKVIEEKDITKEEILKRTVELLPPTWQFPEVSCARIIIDSTEYKTENFKETKWKQASDIIVENEKIGIVEVSYLEEMPSFDEGPFIKEERDLIDEIAERLGRTFERLDAELILKESEKKYRELFENAPDGISIIDSKGYIVDCNTADQELIGYNYKEMVGKHITTFFKGDNKAIFKQKFPILKKMGKVEAELILVRKDGGIIPISRTVSKIYDDNGNLFGGIVHTRDITARKKAEQKLKESEERLAAFMESATDGFVFYDKELNLLEVNNPGLKILGMSKENIIDKNILEISPGLEKIGRYDEYLKVLKTGEPFHVEDLIPHPKFGVIHISVSAFKVGEGLGIIFSDITKRKKAEEALKESEENLKILNEELEQKVEKRTKNLKLAMEDLKRSNTELEQFAYVASHDLQEPLRMVASFTQLLQKRYQDKLDEDANDFINYAVDGATRMQNLISDLLMFSRVGTRGKPFKNTDMNAVLEGVITSFRQLIKETNVTLTYNPLPMILADESQMIQLLQNLISNAIKFHKEEEPPVVHISAKLQKNQWIISVRDNGIGIDSQFFDRIFIIFQRLHKKDEFGGTGIGLAICKKIIQRHGGKIWVESELGKGSTFYFSIPKTEVRK